jgi:prolipoprotein diacylglyceryltransferase
VEFFRAKDDRLLGPFSVAQLISLLLIVGGALVAARLARGGSTAKAGARPAAA